MSGDDADLPIIDVHHHYWDLSYKAHPWLVDEPMIPFRYGDYSAIRRDFLPEDYVRVSAGHRVIGTITIEAEWREDDLFAEKNFIFRLEPVRPWHLGHVGRVILHRDDAPELMQRHGTSDIVRGIRHKPAVIAVPGPLPWGAAGSMSDPAWRRGYGLLEKYALHFELQAPWWHIDELIDLVSAFPKIPVVINHAFLPADRSPEGLAGWRAALRRAASAPQVSIKISGLGIRGRPWSLDDNRGVIRDVIEIFGVDRCMFASNFPVDGLVGTFDTIYSGFKAATDDMATDDRAKLFAGNASRIYRVARPDNLVRQQAAASRLS